VSVSVKDAILLSTFLVIDAFISTLGAYTYQQLI